MAKQKTLSFEETLERLETVVEQLERGETPLEESLRDFQQGMEMAARLRAQLDQAQQRIAEVVEKHGGALETRPLQPDEDDAS